MMSQSYLSQCPADIEAIQHLKQAVSDGKHWYVALLEAIGLWGSTEEIYNEQRYRYLVNNEAFDWLLLAERLCSEIDGAVPEGEKVNLLFFGTPPIELSREDFIELLGDAKYRAYLNYVYGIVVEEALVSAVEEEVRRERRTSPASQRVRLEQETYRRVYGADMMTLLEQFRKEKGYPSEDWITLVEEKEFTYWLFNHRLQNSDKERVASDTKKALQWLQRQRASAIKIPANGAGDVQTSDSEDKL